jgi:predicted Zn-dependent peptidase
VVTREDVPATLGELESDFPPFETFTLDNGLNVIFVEQHKVPKLHLQLVVGGSNAAAAQDKQGVADFLAELITKGTVIRNASQIEGAIEAVGGSIDSEAALEWTSVGVDVLTPDTRLAFSLLSDLARNATFPQREFDVVQDQYLTILAQDKQNAATLANDEFAQLAYGEHPYAYLQTEATVGGLTRQDVRDFYKTFYRPNNALLVIVGDLTPEAAREEAERAFGMWKMVDVPEFLNYPETAAGDGSVIYLVDRPESEQATIQIGNRAIDARDPDRYALEVLNALLGRGSSSRLYANLREEKGYTYGVYSRFARPNDRGTFRVIGDFDQAHAGDAVREILAELKRVQTEPIGAEELEAAKGQLLGSFALGIEDPADFANQLVARRMTGVPVEELNEYLARLEAVTAEDVQAAAQKHIDSEQPVIVVVGNAVEVRVQLEAIGPVVEVAPE